MILKNKNTQLKERRNLLDIPNELLLLIAQFASYNTSQATIRRYKLVCHQFNNIFSDSSIKKIYDGYNKHRKSYNYYCVAPQITYFIHIVTEPNVEKRLDKKKKKELKQYKRATQKHYISYRKRSMPKLKFNGR